MADQRTTLCTTRLEARLWQTTAPVNSTRPRARLWHASPPCLGTHPPDQRPSKKALNASTKSSMLLGPEPRNGAKQKMRAVR